MSSPYLLPSHFTKSLWKVRPLQVDEKLRVFIEGRDDGIQRYDGGEFQQWLEDCKAGRGDPLEAGAYPLVVQDSDLRQVLEIKYPSERALGTLEEEYGYGVGVGGGTGGGSGSRSDKKKKATMSKKDKASTAGTLSSTNVTMSQGIAIPQWKRLPAEEWPDTILRQPETTKMMPLLVRTVDGGAEPVERSSNSSQGGAVDDEKQGYERAYVRYMMPTPDDWDQAIEYDLDEDDEKWLEAYNRRQGNGAAMSNSTGSAGSKTLKNSKNPKKNGASVLKEEWLEHLIDRMEKEYTSELQKHPEKWISKQSAGGGGEGGGVDGGVPMGYMKGQLPPPLILPSIGEMFPLSVCMKVFGFDRGASGGVGVKVEGKEGTRLDRADVEVSSSPSPSPPLVPSHTQQNIDEKIIKDVYNYWKKKHQKSGLPLIQRLWYEPPWHRKASDQDLDGGDDETVFSGFDLHPSLARIRKRKMNDDEVQLRFDCLRRDFEQVRTIADLIRRREKLKLQETSVLKQEWASRMKDVRRACKSAAAAGQAGTLTFPRPPKLASLVESKRSVVASREHRQDVITEQEQKLAFERTVSEDRAARLAARRDVRAEALRIRREHVAIKKSTYKPKRKDDRKNKKSSSAKKPGPGKQPRNSTGQFQRLDYKETT